MVMYKNWQNISTCLQVLIASIFKKRNYIDIKKIIKCILFLHQLRGVVLSYVLVLSRILLSNDKWSELRERIKMARIITYTITIYYCQQLSTNIHPTHPPTSTPPTYILSGNWCKIGEQQWKFNNYLLYICLIISWGQNY